ncbi:aspartate kinase [Aquimarina muelleri]|uniref:Aspartokinase n=1 Tax=Aquimarina muelleri TaxID=279356 RepID=A0A918N2J9_9FLAO|nr:aspartate kinase [Aquimarina muelleri]MCX2764871.1 aspartate kinase [Aquimarina muelleri]GGX05164.1 aspartokinase [Aquimarina muelleri]
MKILKFGGTSLGSIENLNKVKNILKSDYDQKIVVCSAMSGVTDQLVSLSENIKLKKTKEIALQLYNLKEKHVGVIDNLIEDEDKRKKMRSVLSQIINEILDLSAMEYSEILHSKIITRGEALLTHIFSDYLNLVGVPNELLSAEDFMWVDNIENPNLEKVSKKLNSILRKKTNIPLYITQGFICRNKEGDIDNLRRGGSDYSATIIGAALGADEIQIWTDIDGVHNNDPRYVEDTFSIPSLSYNEASELAYFGAKILHPQTVFPVIDKNIPIVLKNTFNTEALGTIISNKSIARGIKAISAKDKITAVKIKSSRDLMTCDFLKRIFEVFNKYQTSIDMVATSEKSISLTIEDTDDLIKIQKEIEVYAEVIIEPHNSIICIVGESIITDKKSHKLFDALNHISIKMISFGGSDNNISILVETKDKTSALKALHKNLFLIQQEVMI